MAKKTFLLVFAVIFSSLSTIFGQTKRFEVAIEGAPNLSLMTGTGFYKKTVGGFYGGLAFQYNLTPIWSLRTGVGYESKGGAAALVFPEDLTANNVEFEATILNRQNYLTLPVLARANFGKKWRFNLEVGATVGALLSNSSDLIYTKYPVGIFRCGNSNYYRQITALNSFDLAITTGIGTQIPLGKRWAIPVQLRGNMGIINAVDPRNANMRNNSVNLITGLTYQLGQKTTK